MSLELRLVPWINDFDPTCHLREFSFLLPGHRRSSSYGSSSDKLYGPYHHHGGAGGGGSAGGGIMGGMGMGGGGGGLGGQYIPAAAAAPSIYTSYAHPHQPNPYAHLPLFPQVCANIQILYLVKKSRYPDQTYLLNTT